MKKSLGALEYWREAVIAGLVIMLFFTFVRVRARVEPEGGGRVADFAKRELELRKRLARFIFKSYPTNPPPKLRVLHVTATGVLGDQPKFDGVIPVEESKVRMWLAGHGLREVNVLSNDLIEASRGVYQFSQDFSPPLRVGGESETRLVTHRDFTIMPVLVPTGEDRPGDAQGAGFLVLPVMDREEDGTVHKIDQTVDVISCENTSMLMERVRLSPSTQATSVGKKLDLTIVSFATPPGFIPAKD